VPVIIPCVTTGGKHADALCTGFNAKCGDAIVKKAIAIFEKWMKPGGMEALRGCAASPDPDLHSRFCQIGTARAITALHCSQEAFHLLSQLFNCPLGFLLISLPSTVSDVVLEGMQASQSLSDCPCCHLSPAPITPGIATLTQPQLSHFVSGSVKPPPQLPSRYRKWCRRQNLHRHLFTLLSRIAVHREYTASLQGVRLSADVGLQNLNRCRFDRCAHYSRPRAKVFANKPGISSVSNPCIVELYLLWDLPRSGSGRSLPKDVVCRSDQLDRVSTELFDLRKLLKPPAHASASDAEMAKNLEYIEQRKRYAPTARQYTSMTCLTHRCFAPVVCACNTIYRNCECALLNVYIVQI
jgi:hypothetical protein